MPKSIQTLREERVDAAKELRTHYDSYEGKEWDGEAQKKYDKMVTGIESLDGEIERGQKMLDIAASRFAARQQVAGALGISTDQAADIAQKDSAIFKAFLRGGENALTIEQQQHVAEKAALVQNALSTGVGSEGGFLVPDEFSATLIESLKSFGGMRSVARIISTSTGANIPYPTTDATSEIGEIIAENTEVGDDDPVFGTKSLGSFMYSSKGIPVPFQLLQDSAIDIEAHINNRLRMRLGRITNTHYTVGTASGQPEGAVTASGVGKVGATGKAASVDFSDINALIHSVDPAYREGGTCRLMFHDNTLRDLKDISDTQDRPLWLPGVAQGEPDTIYRYPYTINQDMPVMAANAKSILFGDFNNYIIRDVMQTMLFRLTDSAYTRKAQVGFLAFLRSDGKLIDAAAIKHYKNSAT